MTLKEVMKEYGIAILLTVVLLAFLPAWLTPYMGVFGTYTTYVVTGIVVGLSLFLTKRTKKLVEK